jgi:hypothetical protein
MPMPVSAMERVCFSSSSSRSMRFIGLVGEGQVTELIERIRGVGDELAQEDLRMRVERVDDQLEQLIDFGLKFTF